MTKVMTIVVEGYVAGGADRVLGHLLPYFHEFHINLLVNGCHDTSVLLSGSLPDNVDLLKYT